MRTIVGIAALLGIVTWGCASGQHSEPAPSSTEATYERSYEGGPPPSAAPASAPSASSAPPGMPRRTSMARAKEPSAPRPDEAAPQSASKSETQKDGTGDSEDDAPSEARLVHYNGFVRVKVTSITDTLRTATTLCEQAGGYVESLSDARVTLRVPVENVVTVFEQLLTLGDVLARSLTAEDVTESFFAIDLRLKTLRQSRDRLVELLARSKDEHEKLSLLREIRRLSEQVSQLEVQLSTLASLAALSRVTLEAVARQSHESTHAPTAELSAFAWIAALSPFRRDVGEDSDDAELSTPAGFVLLSDRDHWIAESPDGAVIWSSIRDNEPHGDLEFWLQALEQRLAQTYGGTAERLTFGELGVLRMIDPSPTAYRYLVGVRVNGDSLQLVEVYYPSPDHENRYHAAVADVLRKGAP